MLAIVFVRTLRRFGIELQRRVVQFLEPQLARIEARHGIFANQGEEFLPVLFAGTRLSFESERLEQNHLLVSVKIIELLSAGSLTVSVQPDQSSSKGILGFRIARHHKIDELSDTSFFRTRSSVAGDDDLGETLDRGILLWREKQRIVRCWLNLQSGVADMAAGEGPLAESGKLRGNRCGAQNAQNFASLNSLPCHLNTSNPSCNGFFV